MAYKLTIDFRPGKFPFAMNTEADQIVMTREELDSLAHEIHVAQREHDDYTREEYEAEQDALPPHKQDGYAERMYEMADMRRKAERENG